ncbi:kinase-like domain-containing protein [Lentinula raphanica]|uniref:Kinase-like domain-containing protein n=1 Tax=Lentinula raphanica TaxID=153919 RepID=A0AA38PIN7_9AGAR|nr:kinase-like domain-containing protein [Lentinula raphanica]
MLSQSENTTVQVLLPVNVLLVRRTRIARDEESDDISQKRTVGGRERDGEDRKENDMSRCSDSYDNFGETSSFSIKNATMKRRAGRVKRVKRVSKRRKNQLDGSDGQRNEEENAGMSRAIQQAEEENSDTEMVRVPETRDSEGEGGYGDDEFKDSEKGNTEVYHLLHEDVSLETTSSFQTPLLPPDLRAIKADPSTLAEAYLKRALAEYDAFRLASSHRDVGPRPHSARQTLLPWVDTRMAQQIIDEIQVALDSASTNSSRSEVYDKRCFSLLLYLSREYQITPSSMLLSAVRRETLNAVAGGGFSDVYRGTLNGEFVCLKVLRLCIEQDEKVRNDIRKQFCREALIWRQLKHPNILPLLGVQLDMFYPSFCLVSPWMANKDIITYLKKNPEHDFLTILSDIVAGIRYLHSRDPPIVHGDIRGANIMVTAERHCCLADFGLASVIAQSQAWSLTSTSMNTTKGALRWLAPEYIITDNSNTTVSETVMHTSRDIYALGCTVVEILTQKPPFSGCKNDASVILSLMEHQRPLRPPNCSDSIWDITTRCWMQEAEYRPSIHEIEKNLLHYSPPTANFNKAEYSSSPSDLFGHESKQMAGPLNGVSSYFPKNKTFSWP